MSHFHRVVIFSVLCLLTFALHGCIGNGDTSVERIADVPLVDPYSDEEVVIRAEASRVQRVEDAIKHMQNEDYAKAAELLEAVVAEEPEDHRAWFALGLCREWLQDFQSAVHAYKKANFYKSDPVYQKSRVRAEGWL